MYYPYYAFPLPLLSKLRKRLGFARRPLARSLGPFVSLFHENRSFSLPPSCGGDFCAFYGEEIAALLPPTDRPESRRTCTIGGGTTMHALSCSRVEGPFLALRTRGTNWRNCRREDLHYEMARNAALVNHSRGAPSASSGRPSASSAPDCGARSRSVACLALFRVPPRRRQRPHRVQFHRRASGCANEPDSRLSSHNSPGSITSSLEELRLAKIYAREVGLNEAPGEFCMPKSPSSPPAPAPAPAPRK